MRKPVPAEKEAAGVPSAWSLTLQPALGRRASQAVVAERGRL
jgi:hypothetical protein